MKKIATLLLGLFVLGSSASAGSQGVTLVIIANPMVPTTQITARDLNDYYLKKKRFWPDGTTPVRPIDWTEGQPARQVFLSRVLGKSEGEMAQYWMGQKLYTGDQPPMSLDSGNSICNLVSAIKGGLGYFLASSEELKTCQGIKRIGTLE